MEPPGGFGSERRRHKRIPLRVGVGIFCDGEFHVGTATDISESGLFVETRLLHEVQTELEIEILLPGGYDIRARAIVRRLRLPGPDRKETPGMGLELVGLDESERAVIAELVWAGGIGG